MDPSLCESATSLAHLSKGEEEFLLIGCLPGTFITGQHITLQFDAAILDNLLRTAERSLLPWILSDLLNIRKLIFNLKQMC